MDSGELDMTRGRLIRPRDFIYRHREKQWVVNLNLNAPSHYPHLSEGGTGDVSIPAGDTHGWGWGLRHFREVECRQRVLARLHPDVESGVLGVVPPLQSIDVLLGFALGVLVGLARPSKTI